MDAGDGGSNKSAAQRDLDDPLAALASQQREAMEQRWRGMAGVSWAHHKGAWWWDYKNEVLIRTRGEKSSEYKPARKPTRKKKTEGGVGLTEVSGGTEKPPKPTPRDKGHRHGTSPRNSGAMGS